MRDQSDHPFHHRRSIMELHLATYIGTIVTRCLSHYKHSGKKNRYTDTDILNKKMNLIYNYCSSKDIYLKDNAGMVEREKY